MLVEIQATSIKRIELLVQQPEGISNTSHSEPESFRSKTIWRYVYLSQSCYCSVQKLQYNRKFYLNKFSVDSFVQFRSAI